MSEPMTDERLAFARRFCEMRYNDYDTLVMEELLNEVDRLRAVVDRLSREIADLRVECRDLESDLAHSEHLRDVLGKRVVELETKGSEP